MPVCGMPSADHCCQLLRWQTVRLRPLVRSGTIDGSLFRRRCRCAQMTPEWSGLEKISLPTPESSAGRASDGLFRKYHAVTPRAEDIDLWRQCLLGHGPTYRLLLCRLGRGPTLAHRRSDSSALDIAHPSPPADWSKSVKLRNNRAGMIQSTLRLLAPKRSKRRASTDPARTGGYS